jgi:4-hydroxy-4-methyl-2-oxoglutarate aldolase
MSQYRVHATINRPSRELVERLKAINFTILCIYCKLGPSRLIDRAIRPLGERLWSICGPAVTVTMEDPDHFMPSVAIEVAQPGDVIVIAANGEPNALVWGGSLTQSAKHAGVAGVVVDGYVECVQPILRHDLPVFTRGIFPIPGGGNKPGSVNVPVACGGVPVNPGDIVMGNEDGLVVVTEEMVAPVIDTLEQRSERLRNLGKNPVEPHVTFFKARNGMETIKQHGIEWLD